MRDIQVNAYIPVLIPLPIMSVEYTQTCKKTLEFISELTDLEFDLDQYGRLRPEFRVLTSIFDEEINEEIKNKLIIPTHINTRVLRISIVVSIPYSITVTQSDSDKEELLIGDEALALHLSLIGSLLEKRIYDFAFAINISLSRSIHILPGIINLGQSFTRIKEFNPYFIWEAYEKSKHLNWPEFKEISFSEIWKWLSRQRGFQEGFGKGRTGRALNSLVNIQLQGNLEVPESLLWAMIGLESIYTSGKSGLLEQVRDKSQILLGEQTSYKKILSKMYDIRSRFVHGELDFAAYNHIYDDDKIEKYYSEITEAFLVALAVLVCTLQEMILRDWNGLHFQYFVGDSQDDD
jgi:hypothetical protein